MHWLPLHLAFLGIPPIFRIFTRRAFFRHPHLGQIAAIAPPT